MEFLHERRGVCNQVNLRISLALLMNLHYKGAVKHCTKEMVFIGRKVEQGSAWQGKEENYSWTGTAFMVGGEVFIV